jgi:uncharacterized metal-binding protein
MERFVKMPHTFTHKEYADMVYGYCYGSANIAVDEYRRRYLLRRTPNRAFLQTCFVYYVTVGHFLVYKAVQMVFRAVGVASCIGRRRKTVTLTGVF